MLEQLAEHGDSNEGKKNPPLGAAVANDENTIVSQSVIKNDSPLDVGRQSVSILPLTTSAENQDTPQAKATATTHQSITRDESTERPLAAIRSLDRNGKYEVTFKLGVLDLVIFQVADEARSAARGLVKKLREDLESKKTATPDIAINLHELITTPGVTTKYPPFQPTGSLWVNIADWLPSGLRAQLFPGTLCGHKGCSDAPISAAQSIAAQLVGGDAAYFVALGRASNEVVGVQFIQHQDGELTVIAASGLGESLRWTSVQEKADHWQVISRFLQSISNDNRQDLTVLGEPLVISPWSTTIRRSSVLEILGGFATNLESAWLGVPTQLLDSPVILSPSAVNEIGRNRVVCRFRFREDNTLAAVIGPDGVRELAVSPGIKNWFGRGYWTTIWRNAGSPSVLTSAAEVQHVAKTLHSINLKSLLNGTKRVELDGFATSPLERSVELLHGARHWISRIFRKEKGEDSRLSFGL